MGTTVECMITYADTSTTSYTYFAIFLAPISQPETKAWDSWIRELHEEKPVSAQIRFERHARRLLSVYALVCIHTVSC